MSLQAPETPGDPGDNQTATAQPGSSTSAFTHAGVRLQRACSSCARQKCRCDGSHPCSRCVSLKQPELCEFLPSLRGKIKKRRSRPLGDGNEHGSEGPPSKTPRLTPSLHVADVMEHNRDREEDFTIWRNNEAINASGPSNSSLFDNRWSSNPTLPIALTIDPPRSGTSPTNIRTPVHDKLTTLPLPGDAPNPLSVLAEASVTAHGGTRDGIAMVSAQAISVSPGFSEGTSQDEHESGGGYYAPVERVLKEDAPHILTLISVQEAEQLFDIYFKSMHPHFPLLDPEQSSPVNIARRNNFLFNAICCVAARGFHVVLWERLKKGFARFEMERLPKEKNIDVVQGQLIYAQWNLMRPKHFEQDMTWLRVGLAVRTAIDINLHRVALLKQARDELPEWIFRSILRTWLCCYIVDRTLSAQLGKPASVRGENAIRLYLDLIKRHNTPSNEDVWVASMAEWTMILTRAMDSFRNEGFDYSSGEPRNFGSQTSALPDIVHIFARQFRSWHENSTATVKLLAAEERMKSISLANMSIYEGYARLVVHSFGLQRVQDVPGDADFPAALVGYQTSAVRLIQLFETGLETAGYLRGCPDFVFTALTYAGVSALKVTQLQASNQQDESQRIITLVRRAADMLARAAMTPDHLPASQNVLLSRLLAARPKQTAEPEDAPSEGLLDISFAQSFDFDKLFNSIPTTSLGDMRQLGLEPEQPSSQVDLNPWYQPTQGARTSASQSVTELDPFGQDQELLFTHASTWKSMMDARTSNTGP